MKAKISLKAYAGGNTQGAILFNKFLKKNAGKWVGIETKYLFQNQYNTVNGYRILDIMIDEIKEDARINNPLFKDAAFVIWEGKKPKRTDIPKTKIGSYIIECDEYTECISIRNNRQRLRIIYHNNIFWECTGIGYNKTLLESLPYSQKVKIQKYIIEKTLTNTHSLKGLTDEA